MNPCHEAYEQCVFGTFTQLISIILLPSMMTIVNQESVWGRSCLFSYSETIRPTKIKQNQPFEVWYAVSWPTICLSCSKNNWHACLYCDVLVRAPSLSGLHKQKALHCNQHSDKAQTCLTQTWIAPLCHCQQKEKTTTVVSFVNEGHPAAHSLWYAILDVIWEMHMLFAFMESVWLLSKENVIFG